MRFFLSVIFCYISCGLAQDGNRVLLDDAVKEGAVCLDGSAPGYYFRQGGAAMLIWLPCLLTFHCR